jgi:hypothetical protein
VRWEINFEERWLHGLIKRLIVGISGARGVIYGIRMLEMLKGPMIGARSRF